MNSPKTFLKKAVGALVSERMKPEGNKNNAENNSKLVEGALGLLINHQEASKDKFFSQSGTNEELLATGDEKACAERVKRARSHNYEPGNFRNTMQGLTLQKIKSVNESRSKVHPGTLLQKDQDPYFSDEN